MKTNPNTIGEKSVSADFSRNEIIIDVETTGIFFNKDEILEIAIISAIDGAVLFNSYICPTNHTSWKMAEDLHHISYDMVKNAPVFSEVKQKIQEIVNSAELIIGYNAPFIVNFLSFAGIDFRGRKILDFIEALRLLFCKKIRCLTEWVEYFGYEFTDDSRAVSVECQRIFTLYRDKRIQKALKENENKGEKEKL